MESNALKSHERNLLVHTSESAVNHNQLIAAIKSQGKSKGKRGQDPTSVGLNWSMQQQKKTAVINMQH